MQYLNPHTLNLVYPNPTQRQFASNSVRERAYQQKLKEIASGAVPDDFHFFTGELVRYLIEKQSINERDFSRDLGYNPNYFNGNIFQNGCNDGGYFTSRPFNARIIALTCKSLEAKGIDPIAFWDKRKYSYEDACSVKIDTDVNLTEIIAKIPRREPSDAAKVVLERIPELATTLLIDPLTGGWRHGTFLFNDEGNPAKNKEFRGIAMEMQRYEPSKAIELMTNPRTPNEPLYRAKGVFMRRVLKEAQSVRLVTAIYEALKYLPLRDSNAQSFDR